MFILAALLGVIPVNQAWLDARTPPYQLTETGEVYELQTDVATDGMAFKVRALDVTLDLNGHTVTYDRIGGGVPDHSFEVGNAWDMSGAPDVARVQSTRQPRHLDYHLEAPYPETDQTIVSDWTDLPPDTDCYVSMIKVAPTWVVRSWVRLEVEHETLGVIAGTHSLSISSLSFTTPSDPGRYRIRCTLVAEDLEPWKPNHEYRIGDVVETTTQPDDRVFPLDKVDGNNGGLSGPTEPEWNTELGGLTEDGPITWVTRAVGLRWGGGGKWQPGKSYQPIYSYVTPTVSNGCSYECYRVTAPGATSGPTEPEWLNGNQPITVGNLTWGIKRKKTIELDMVDVRPHGIRGIEFQWWGSGEKKVTIRNGFIRQGAGGSYQGHAVYVGGANGAVLEDLDIETNGLEAAAIQGQWSEDVTVRNNKIVTGSSHKFNRHQLSAPLSIVHTSGGSVTGNEVVSDEGWGCIFVSNREGEDPFLVENNVCSTRSVITNHYAILAYGYGHTVRNNVIDCDPGQGLRLSKKGNLAEGNTITIHSVSPNWDINRLSLDAIRLNDYNSSNSANQGSDNVVRNNTITLYGRNSTRFDREQQILNGICNVSRGDGNVYEGNTITAVKVDPEVVVSGLMPGNTGGQIVWRDNTITSDQYGMMFGHYSGKCANALFEGNQFIEGENAGEDYALMHSHGRAFEVLDTSFRRTQIIGRGDLRKIYGDINWSKNSSWTVGESEQVTLSLEGSYDLSGVKVFDKDGNLVHDGGTTIMLGGGYGVEFRRGEPPYWFYTGDSGDAGAPYSLQGVIE